MNIVKRDGRIVPFNRDYIVTAIKKAFKQANQVVSDDSILEMLESISIWDGITVEEIQDQVVELLKDFGYSDVSDMYSAYRQDRAIIRAERDSLTRELKRRLLAQDVENSNANMDERSFGGRMGEAASAVAKEYALNHIMSQASRENHLNNEIYIHDLSNYAIGNHNCLTLPIAKLLKEGAVVNQADLRPARSITSALNLLAVYFQVQSQEQFGGVAASSLDWDLIPYIRISFRKHWLREYRKLASKTSCPTFFSAPEDLSIDDVQYKELSLIYTYAMEDLQKELDQAVEGMFHNLNTLQSRSGAQLPFSSINFGTCTLPEGRMLIKAILEGQMRGIGKYHRTPIFPCTIFKVKSGVNKEPDTPNYDLFLLALKCTALRMYPNYVNVDWSVNAGYDPSDPHQETATMGCRTYNGYDINGLGYIKDGRGNICPVTIIMPTLAMMATERAKEALSGINDPTANNSLQEEITVSAFLQILDKKIGEAKDMLLERFDWICKQSADSAKFMYTNQTMAGYKPKGGIKSALKHGTIVIGQLGLAETLQVLIGKDHTTEEGMELAKKIEALFLKRCTEFKNEYKLNFGVYYTPAENLCYTAMKKFQEKYGVIENVSDREFFTNSIHVPVWKEITPFEKIDIESQLTGYSNAGCITYVELESTSKHNLEALEELVNYAMDKDIPYFAINIPNDTCLDCGYTDEFNDTCPVCGSHNIQQLRRVTGYLTGNYKTAFNKGKIQETDMRVKHNHVYD